MKHAFRHPFGCLLSLVLLWLLVEPTASGQIPGWQTVLAAVPSNGSNAYVRQNATDGNGNVLISGSFSGTVMLGNVQLISAGGSDVFIAKWNHTNNSFEWVKRAGGRGDDYATALAVTGTSVYIAGSFEGLTAGFDNIVLSKVGGDDIFVAKILDTGTNSGFSWAQRAGGGGIEQATAMAVNGNNVYVTGRFSSSPATFGSNVISAVGDTDVFIAKLTDAGSTADFVWVQRAGGTFSDEASAIAVSGSNIYLAGNFQGQATFGNIALTVAGITDVFVVKLVDTGTTGSFIWAQRAGSTENDGASAVVVQGNSVYVAGSFRFNPASFGNIVLANRGGYDGFVAKLLDGGSASSFVWVQSVGGAGDDQAIGLAVSGANLYLTGGFSSTAVFGAASLASAGGYDIFVAKLTDVGSGGNVVWVQQAGSPSNDFASALTISRSRLYIGGSVGTPASFGTLGFASPMGSTAGFLASLTDPTLTATIPALTAAIVTIFPNPAHGTATIQLPAIPGTATAILTLLDALGRTLRTQTAPTNARAELDLTGLAPGLYAVRVQAGAATAMRRLVVE